MSTDGSMGRRSSIDSRFTEDSSETAAEIERRLFQQKYKARTVHKEKRTVDRNVKQYGKHGNKKFQLPDDVKFALSVACGQPMPKAIPLPKIISEGVLLFTPEIQEDGTEGKVDDKAHKEKEVRIADTPNLEESKRPESSDIASQSADVMHKPPRPKTTGNVGANPRGGSGKAGRTTSASRVCSAKTAETSQTSRKCGRTQDGNHDSVQSTTSIASAAAAHHRSRSAKGRQSRGDAGLRHRRKSRNHSVVSELQDSDFFDSDSDLDQEHTPNNAKEEVRLYRRACEGLRVVTSRRVETGLTKGHVDVSFSQLTPEELKAICIAIVESHTISRIELAGNTLSEHCLEYLCEVLAENNYVKEVNISDCRADRQGVANLIKCLKKTNAVTSLDLSGIPLILDQVKLLGKYITSSTALYSLSLSYCGIDEAGGNVLAEALGSTICLTSLDLSWNQLRHKGALNLCLALKENDTLRTVNLSWNGLGRDGCMGLETSLAKNCTLQHLDLSSNRIGVLGLDSLLRGLSACSTLMSFKIANNPLPTESGTEIINMLLNSPKSALNVVDMSQIAVEDSFLEKLSELRRQRVIYVFHGPVISRIKDLGGQSGPKSLSSFDPILVLFEYMKVNNMRLIDLFRSLDKNGDKVISREELRAVFLSLNMGLPAGAFDSMFHKIDADHSNTIDMDELKLVHRRVMRQARALKARAANSEDDEYGDVVHEFQSLVRKAVTQGRSRRPSRVDLSRSNSISGPLRR